MRTQTRRTLGGDIGRKQLKEVCMQRTVPQNERESTWEPEEEYNEDHFLEGITKERGGFPSEGPLNRRELRGRCIWGYHYEKEVL